MSSVKFKKKGLYNEFLDILGRRVKPFVYKGTSIDRVRIIDMNFGRTTLYVNMSFAIVVHYMKKHVITAEIIKFV